MNIMKVELRSVARTRRTVCLLLLTFCLLLPMASCGKRPSGPGKVPGRTEPEPQPTVTEPLPEGAMGAEFEDAFSIHLPGGFHVFPTSDKKALGAYNDGNAQFYVRKCVASDTGTSESYFASLTASEYGDLVLYDVEDYEEYAGHGRHCAGFIYRHEGTSPEETVVYCVYYVKDAKSGCFWQVEARFPGTVESEYLALFDKWDQYFLLVK